MAIGHDRTEESLGRSVDLRGQKLDHGRYEIEGVLGCGSMGYVYRAYDQRLETEVVIKVPTLARLEDPEFFERFLQECRFLVRLSHPNIVKVIDVGRHEQVPYVVMQHLAGGNLRERMLKIGADITGMPASSLKTWLMDIAKALDFMHWQNFIHRDVKPANILFDEHGHAFLSDFGLAKILAEDGGMTAAGAVVGSPNYTAPEIVLANKYDGRADQYSLAITVHEVLTGQVPLCGGSATATMVMQTNTQPQPLCEINSNFSRQLSRIVLKALSKNPKERFQSCVAFANAVLIALGIDSGASSIRSPLPSNVHQASEIRHISERSVPRKSPAKTSLPPRVNTQQRMNNQLPPRVMSYGSGSRYAVTKVSQGSNGRIPCPSCRKVLVLKLKHAGRHGVCKTCSSRLLIASNLESLKLLEPIKPGMSLDSRVQVVTLPKSGSQGEADLILGTSLFGLRLGKGVAITLAFVLIAFLIGMSSFLTSQKKELEKAPPPTLKVSHEE